MRVAYLEQKKEKSKNLRELKALPPAPLPPATCTQLPWPSTRLGPYLPNLEFATKVQVHGYALAFNGSRWLNTKRFTDWLMHTKNYEIGHIILNIHLPYVALQPFFILFYQRVKNAAY